jgi:hypothetical protein
MENMIEPLTPDEAAEALADAEASGRLLVDRATLPSLFATSIGGAIAVQIALTATGLDSQGWAAGLLLGAGVLIFATVSAVQLARFRRLNGVWLGGLASRVVFGTGTLTSVGYALGLAAATWAAFAGLWWLVPLCALAGGAVYAVNGRVWWRTYRGDPATHGAGESAVVLAASVILALAGAVLVVTAR